MDVKARLPSRVTYIDEECKYHGNYIANRCRYWTEWKTIAQLVLKRDDQGNSCDTKDEAEHCCGIKVHSEPVHPLAFLLIDLGLTTVPDEISILTFRTP
jgi:hypothetical protein